MTYNIRIVTEPEPHTKQVEIVRIEASSKQEAEKLARQQTGGKVMN